MNRSKHTTHLDIIHGMLQSLTAFDEKTLGDLVAPLRDCLADMKSLGDPRGVHAKFKGFVKTRDERLIAAYLRDQSVPTPEEQRRIQETINKILDQVLNLLEKGLHSTEDIAEDLKTIMQKVYKAKTINNIRSLSEEFIRVGNEMKSRNNQLHQGLGKLARELTHYRCQIEDLERELDATREEEEGDSLTGLRNRRVFDRELAEGVERSRRFGVNSCLMLMDIDHFKDINDIWGHHVGDDVLINFAKLLGDNLRDFDRAYRLGGDDFAALFSGIELEIVTKIADRLRAYMAGHAYHVKGGKFTLTISCGIAEWQEGETARQLFERADQRLYDAKKSGRNRVVR